MTRAPERHLVDSLARLASGAEPPALDDAAARRMLDAAVAAPRLTAPPRAARRPFVLAGAAFAVASAVAVLVLVRPRAPEAPALSQLTLPTGDHIAGTAGAQFEIVELSRESRRLRLTSGEMVFDVAHAAPHQHFEVATADTTVVATGTVFSVFTDGTVTRVHVFEGSVAVEHAHQRAAVAPGASWSSDDAGVRASRAITAAGESFVHQRSSAPASASPAPAAATASAPPSPPMVAAAPPEPPASPVVAAAPRESQPSARDPAPTPMPPAPEPAPAPMSLADARAAIAAGRYDEALAAADAPGRAGESGPWELVRGDALRALGRFGEAAAAYEAGVRALVGPARAEAAYEAAYVRLRELRAPAAALADLDGVADGSALEERALVLRVRALVELKRDNEARVIAGRYLDRFPGGGEAAKMRALVAAGR